MRASGRTSGPRESLLGANGALLLTITAPPVEANDCYVSAGGAGDATANGGSGCLYAGRGRRVERRRAAACRLLALCASVAAGQVQAATRPATDCTSAAVQAAIDAAGDGDLVTVPACPAGSWSADVSIPDTKGITLQGAGADKTIITTGRTLTLHTSPARSPTRLTGFKFVRTGDATRVRVLGNARSWRIDHNVFDDAGVWGPYTIEVGVKGDENQDNYNYGVIDHNEFINRNYATSVFITWVRNGLDAVASGDWVWSQPAQRGTEQAVYIEDNVFAGTMKASQVVDTQYGAKVVVRYNTIHNPWISTHSGCTNNGRNSPWTEVYKNRFTDGANRYGGSQIEMRSTSGVLWGNTATTPLDQFRVTVDHERSYRTDCSGPYGGRADGTRPFDENAGLHGYRTLGQPGWGQPQAKDMSAATFAGVFAWDNRDGAARVDLGIANAMGYTTEHLQMGRELFNEAHMTAGPGAARPGTCSVGPPRSVYVATDENSAGARLYVCTATGVWTKHWEPFAYPHPLTLGSTGDAGDPDGPAADVGADTPPEGGKDAGDAGVPDGSAADVAADKPPEGRKDVGADAAPAEGGSNDAGGQPDVGREAPAAGDGAAGCACELAERKQDERGGVIALGVGLALALRRRRRWLVGDSRERRLGLRVRGLSGPPPCFVSASADGLAVARSGTAPASGSDGSEVS